MSKEGYISKIPGWTADPALNSKINIGCDTSCKVKEGFVCSNSSTLLCSDTCHDGVFDGSVDGERSSRTLMEQCDTGGASEGCDELCQVRQGYECTLVQISLDQPKGGKFTSICSLKNGT